MYLSENQHAEEYFKKVLNFQDISKYNICFENEFVDGLGAGEVKF